MKKKNLSKKLKWRSKLMLKMKSMQNKAISLRNNTKLKKNKSQEKLNQKRGLVG